MKRKAIYAPIMLLTFAIGLSLPAIRSIDRRTNSNERWAEENAVYSVLINVRLPRDKDVAWLIASDSISLLPEDGSFDEKRFIDLNAPKGLSIDTLRDYKEIDSQTRSVAYGLRLDQQPIFFANEDVKKIYGFSEEFITLRKTYPHSNGVTMLSRVGFNKIMDEALVYSWQFCGGDCGEGGYFLLKKKSGVWKITSERIWIS